MRNTHPTHTTHTRERERERERERHGGDSEGLIFSHIVLKIV